VTPKQASGHRPALHLSPARHESATRAAVHLTPPRPGSLWQSPVCQTGKDVQKTASGASGAEIRYAATTSAAALATSIRPSDFAAECTRCAEKIPPQGGRLPSGLRREISCPGQKGRAWPHRSLRPPESVFARRAGIIVSLSALAERCERASAPVHESGDAGSVRPRARAFRIGPNNEAPLLDRPPAAPLRRRADLLRLSLAPNLQPCGRTMAA
jgi:hypothetical protein